MSKKKLKTKILIFLGVIIILIGGLSMILYKPELQTLTKNLINPVYSSFFNSATIPITQGYFTGTFTYELSGNESKWVEDVKFNGREVTIIPKEKIEDRTYLECLEWKFVEDKLKEITEICTKEETKVYSIPEIMPIKVLDEKITNISKEIDSKTLTSSFNYIIPNDVHEFKIGENSIIIREDYVVSQANLVNVTSEGNFTHLNISTTAPYNSLIGYWNFDGDKTNTKLTKHYDWTKNNNDGTGVADALVNSAGCVYDDCLQLDGTGDFVNGGDIDILDNPTNFSFCIWVYHNSISDDDSILGKSYSATDGWLLFRDDVGVGGNDIYSLYIADSTGTDNVRLESPPGSSVLNSWTHVCGTYAKLSATGLRLYVNGTEVPNSPLSLTSIGGIDSSTYPFYIGYRDTSALVFNGTTDEVMVFNGTLTDAQILAIYNNQSARFLATGTQDIVNQSYMNISTGNNRVNVTTYIESLLGSSINLSVGYYDTSWAYTTPQVVSSGIVKTFTISSTSTNLTLNYTFYAGNLTNPFYSPILKSNITFDVWNVAEDTIYPSFSGYYDNNATLLDNGTGYFNVVVKNTNGTVILYINNTHISATLGCQNEPGFYVEPDYYTCLSISDETACLEQSNCNWDGACQTVTYPYCNSFQSQATCEGSNQADVCTWSYGTFYEFTNSGTYMYNWTSYGNGTSHNLNISSNRNYLVNSSIANCWTKTGNILYIPRGCIYQLNKGSIYKI